MRGLSIKRRLVGLTLMLAIAGRLALAAGNGDINVVVESDPVQAGQSFVLTFEARDVDDTPDFKPLEQDFDILGTSQRTNISVDNGRMEKTTVWQLNLLPRRAGEITIPAIRFGKDSTEAMTITALGADPGASSQSPTDAMRLEVKATPEDPYVQAQVVVTVTLLIPEQVDMVDSAFSDPHVNGGDALIVSLGKPRERFVFENDTRLRVVERSYSVFPQRHGDLKLDPITFEGRVFAGSASLDNPFTHSVRAHRLQSEPVLLHVKPVPPQFNGAHWLPAATLGLVQHWSDESDTLTAGEPVTRNLTLVAKGLTAGQLPAIASPEAGSLRSYPEQPVLDDNTRSDGVTGLRMEKHALIANANGEYTLAEIRIPWWNTTTDKPEVAVLPARTLRVEGGVAAAPATMSNNDTQAASGANAMSGNVDAPKSPVVVAPTASGWWQTFAAILASGWAFTAWFWWRSIHRRGVKPAMVRSDGDLVGIENAVINGSRNNDAQTTRAALLDWARARHLHPPSLETIARNYPTLRASLAEMDDALYSRRTEEWNGSNLYSAFADQSRRLRRHRDSGAKKVSALAPLYLPAGGSAP